MSSPLRATRRPSVPETSSPAGTAPVVPGPPTSAADARWPGVVLCSAIAVAAVGAEWLEVRLTGMAHIEALVLAILLGAAVRTAWEPGRLWTRGISFSARELLEVAVVLLGATLDLPLLLRAGPVLLAGIAGTVVAALATGYTVARLLGLSPSLATLIACGNAICGNSAIAAVAPVIGADGSDVAASIAFTAILGVVVVLALPPLGVALGLSEYGYGVVAGLTVYAVPQVIAATFPVGVVAGQVGTLVKLVRVLMLGPVVIGLSLLHRRDGRGAASAGGRPSITRLVPWFIIGFLGLATARAVGLVPAPLVAVAGEGANVLTLLSMAALGMGVDVRVLARVGARVTTAVISALSVLVGISLLLVHLLRL
ncbi:MAG: YeiH family protein [Gemmatimonadaceae bacterium]